jgi:hypothetical protein
MTQEITDAMLDEQAEHLTSLFAMAGYGTFTQDPERIYRNVTRTALEVERACYYVLKEARSIAMRDASEHEDPSLYVMQLRAIIDRLRTRLGINPE